MSDLVPTILFTAVALIAAISLVIALRRFVATARELRAALRQTPEMLNVNTEILDRIVTPVKPVPIRRAGARRSPQDETAAPLRAA